PDVNSGYTLTASPPSRLLFMPGSGTGINALLAVLLMVMPTIVLLVACLNLADLLLARGHVRRQELAIRSSLGGGRGRPAPQLPPQGVFLPAGGAGRVSRKLLAEGLLLALGAGALGLWLSTWAVDALLTSLRPVLPVA